jgi:hypothetical protein
MKTPFTEKEKAIIEFSYNVIRDTANRIKKNPKRAGLVEGEDPHIWARLKQLTEMPKEELIAELEADYVLLNGCFADSDPERPFNTPSRAEFEQQDIPIPIPYPGGK